MRKVAAGLLPGQQTLKGFDVSDMKFQSYLTTRATVLTATDSQVLPALAGCFMYNLLLQLDTCL